FVSLLLVFSTIVRAATTDVQYCEENAEYEVKVKEVNIAPNPIARGEPATFTISANTERDNVITAFEGCRLLLDSQGTSSWRFLDIEPDFDLDFCQTGVSVKGNTYFVAQHNTAKLVNVLLYFDFTTERFCQPLPFHYTAEFENVALSCVGEEKLAVLYKHEGTMEIWITTNIEHDAVSWSKASVCNVFEDKPTKSHQICYSQTAHIIGQDGYLKSVRIGESRNNVLDEPLVFSSYVPSLVQLGINQEEHTK
ncbi:hypothetical protein F2Q68_00020557, partial [Brassica cretica]